MRQLLLVPFFALAACGEKVEAPAKQERAAPAAVPASDLLITRKSELLDFEWRAAPEIAAAPVLLTALRNEALAAAKELETSAKDDRDYRGEALPAPYMFSQDWRVDADTPTLLGISAEVSQYTGGAHPNHGFVVKYWDKKTAREIGFADLFTDWPAAAAALTPAYCRALDEERLKRRGEEINDIFSDCPALEGQWVALVSYQLTGITGFRVLLGPYVAGPYSEGSYEIDVPLADDVRALMNPAHFPG